MQSALPSPSLTVRPPNLAKCLAFSLALHAALASPWLYAMLVPAQRPKSQQLVLDLSGIQSQRQVQQQHQQTPPPRHEKAPTRQSAPTRTQPLARAAPNDVPLTPEQPKQEHEQQTAPAPQPVARDEQTAVEQHVVPQESDETLMRRYLAALRKSIQSHLAYPANARDLGQVGATIIRFTLTESGEIQPESLSIQTSSGSTMLDASALKAAQAAAPFMRPPRRMNVVIGLSFFRES